MNLCFALNICALPWNITCSLADYRVCAVVAFLCICVFSSDVFLLCNTFVFSLEMILYSGGQCTQSAIWFQLVRPLLPCHWEWAQLLPMSKRGTLSQGSNKTTWEGYWDIYLQVDESDNTTEGLMHTTPLKNCLHVPISKRGTLSQIEQLYEIASEAQLHWCAQGRPILKWVRISFMLLHGVQICQTSKQRNCLWDWTLQLESLAANQSQAWKAEEQTVQIFLALAYV